MCLFTNQETPLTASRNIKCLKVVFKDIYDGNVIYRSLFGISRYLHYTIGKTINMNDELIPGLTPLCELKSYFEPCTGANAKLRRRVDEGLHTFPTDSKTARSLMLWAIDGLNFTKYNNTLGKRKRVVRTATILECEIPEGTLFFEGHSNCFPPECGLSQFGYVSEYLKVNRELTEEEIEKLPYKVIPY